MPAKEKAPPAKETQLADDGNAAKRNEWEKNPRVLLAAQRIGLNQCHEAGRIGPEAVRSASGYFLKTDAVFFSMMAAVIP